MRSAGWQQLRRASAALAALCAYQLPGLRLFRCGLGFFDSGDVAGKVS